MTMPSEAAKEIAANCLGVRVRALSRAVTALFDDALRDHGVTVPQLNILAVIGAYGPVRPSFVADVLIMEKSTVSRNLDRMIEKGWVEIRPAEDARSHTLALAPAGGSVLERLRDDWRNANARAQDLLGPEGRSAVPDIFDRLIRAVP